MKKLSVAETQRKVVGRRKPLSGGKPGNETPDTYATYVTILLGSRSTCKTH